MQHIILNLDLLRNPVVQIYKYSGWIKSNRQRWCHMMMVCLRAASFPAAIILCPSTAVCRMLTFIGIMRAPYDLVYKTRAMFLDENWTGTIFVQHSGVNYNTWWYRTPSFLMTVQGVPPLLRSRTSCNAGNSRFWNIHHTIPIWIQAIIISLPEWENHWEGPATTQEMNLSVL